ncbi:MAG: hypothetical protein FIO02_02285 [Nitrosopumilales archaeon]|nr:hypothetical protein [Nitrosopumilales archaeon]
MDVDLFTADLDGLSAKMTSGERDELVQRMNFVKYRLIELYKKNLVKINHSVMELVCARHLIRYGYAVDVEKQLTDILVCDLHGSKGNGDTVVEIETGFVPPDHALDPLSYYYARVASKIARYSRFANQFVLATTPVSILPIPEMYRRPPRDRKNEEITKLKRVCDKYYRNPPITEEEIVNGRIHMIYIIDIDQGNVIEMDVESYFESVRLMTPISSIIYGCR